MVRLSRSGLSTRLMVLVLLAILPLLALILVNAAAQRQSAAARAQSDALRIARFAAANQAQFIEQTRQLMVNLAGSPDLRASGIPLCGDVFPLLQTQYAQQRPRYINLGLIETGGRITCSVERVVGPIDLSGLAYVQRALQTLTPVLGDYEYDAPTGKTFVNFVYPLLDFNSRPRALLFAALDLAWLNDLAAEAQLPAGATFTVLDRTGTILIRYPEPASWVGRALPETPIIDAILMRGAEGTAEAADIDDVQRLYAFTPLEGGSGGGPAAYVSIGIPVQAAYAEADQILAVNLVALALVAAFIVPLTRIAGDRLIIRPLQSLVAATRRLSQGDLSARSGVPAVGRQSEIGQLALAFDQMAESLQQRQIERERAESALRKSEELYRTLARNFPNGAVILFDRDLRYTLADGAGLAEIGLSREQLEGRTIWDIFPPDTSAVLEPHYRAALAGTSTSFEVAYAERVYLVHTLPLRNERGDIFAGMTMTQDITDRKRDEDALQTSEARFRSAFDDAAIGMALVAPDNRYLRVNRAYCEFLGYAEPELLKTTFVALTHPDDIDADLNQFGHLLSGAIRHYEMEKRFIHRSGRIVWGLLSVSLVRDAHGQPLYSVSQLQNITARKHMEETLREREEQYRGIFESSIDGLFINRLDGALVDFNPAAARMHGYTPEEFRRLQPPDFIHTDSLHLFDEYMDALRAGRQFRTRALDRRRDGTVFPIEVFGTGFVYRGEPHALAVVRDITVQVEAERLLEQRVEERTRELSTLLEVTRNVASTLELQPLLGLILDQLKTLVDYAGATIFTLQEDELVILDYRGPITPERARQLRFRLSTAGANREVIERREPVIIDDVRGDSDLARAFRATAGGDLETKYGYIRAWLGVPLMIKEWVIGMLSIDHGQPGHFTPQHAKLALAIANQAAVAIENARLYEQAQELAALEERQKLARELHDSVSQALYGIALGARTARTLLDRDASRAAEPLDYVLSLTEAGLAEMRALIFELRPESLETEGLVAALTKQAAFVRARHGLEVRTAFCDEPSLPIEVKTALYRIAQEALHNVVKHARAARVDLRLEREPASGAIALRVHDDGQGFDAGGTFPGHLGLHTMRERAEKIGCAIEVDSAPGKGTRITVRVLIGAR